MCFLFTLRMLMASANKYLDKKFSHGLIPFFTSKNKLNVHLKVNVNPVT